MGNVISWTFKLPDSLHGGLWCLLHECFAQERMDKTYAVAMEAKVLERQH